MALKLECGYLKGFIGEHEYAAMASQVENAHALLASGPLPDARRSCAFSG